MKKKITKKLFNYLDIPIELSSEAFITMRGSEWVKIENHRGLVECTQSSVALKMKKGMLRVVGSGLMINELISDALEIRGDIKSIEFLT
ncbi:MAG TPA: YabP/YqfC family sporulation protein [Clostridia bacterium]|nr:YabP/YqfC family sporulation protein [Clostridia bacterium]